MIKRKLNSFASSALLIFLGAIFLVVIGNELFISKSLKEFSQYDSTLINDLGKIRGGIQRYTKFRLINDTEKSRIIENEIEKYFKNIQFYTTNSNTIIPDRFIVKFFDLYNTTLSYWNSLKAANNRQDLIKISEKAWNSADRLTNLMTTITNYRFNALKNIVLFFTIASAVIIIILSTLVLYYVKRGLEKATITDPLTKLYNRLYFDIQYTYLLNKYKRNKTPFSVFLFDIDDFKQINDTYGHPVGDEVLVQISNTIKKTIRNTDLAFRYGGEEFIILFPDTKFEDAQKVAERIKKNIMEKVIIDGKSVTISGGVGEYNGHSPYHFLNEIDKALYVAKKSGKNRIVSVT